MSFIKNNFSVKNMCGLLAKNINFYNWALQTKSKQGLFPNESNIYFKKLAFISINNYTFFQL